MKASDLFIKALEMEGVEYIFGVPGEENLDLLQSIKHSTIRFITTRHEQAAGFMAANYGRITEKPGVCLSTLGPGLTNLVTSTAYAFLGAMPSLIISGQKPVLQSKQGRFQIINAVNLMSPISKYSKQIITPDSIPGIIHEAFRVAVEERPGPVHLELPEDIAAMETNHHLYTQIARSRPIAPLQSLQNIAHIIEAADHPLVLIGLNANRSSVVNPLTHFVEKTGIPFFTTQMGKGVIDERHRSYLGTAALSDSDLLHKAIIKSDVIINIGHEIIEKPPFLMAFGKHGKRQVLHINYNTSEVDDIYFPQHEAIGDIAHSMDELSKLVSKQTHWNFEETFKIKESIKLHLSKYINDDRFPIIPHKMIHTIRNIVPEDGIVCLDNGMYKIWFARDYTSFTRNTLILDNALASMGAGFPAAIATKLQNPHKKVIAVCGDGGFMMNSQEIETAKRLGLDITIIVLNDGGYGMIKWKQAEGNFESFALDFTNPDFVKYIESYGGTGYKPKSVVEFKDNLTTAINSSGIHLIDLAIDYSLDSQILQETRH